MKLYIVDPHSIYRRGLVASLAVLDEVDQVREAESVKEAWLDAELPFSDLVIVDHEVLGGPEFVAQVSEATDARVLVCTARGDEDLVLASMRAGAVGVLSKDVLTPASLSAAVRAAISGSGVMAPEALLTLLGAAQRGSREGGGGGPGDARRLTTREQRVLALIAEGHATREVAAQLCYSERTVKNVLHDVTTKLNARSRSQAVAFAVREGLI